MGCFITSFLPLGRKPLYPAWLIYRCISADMPVLLPWRSRGRKSKGFDKRALESCWSPGNTFLAPTDCFSLVLQVQKTGKVSMKVAPQPSSSGPHAIRMPSYQQGDRNLHTLWPPVGVGPVRG